MVYTVYETHQLYYSFKKSIQETYILVLKPISKCPEIECGYLITKPSQSRKQLPDTDLHFWKNHKPMQLTFDPMNVIINSKAQSINHFFTGRNMVGQL